MDIKRAKQEIMDAVKAYLIRDEEGGYLIPAIRQRPVLLMGPPGIGKTQIMEQIARECKIGLVAYTITHHTRQSAVGLPFIREKSFGGKTFSVTEYTMSEIIAAVYEKMERTGLSEGILFIDEINCVSETLAPTMLQFLQCKTFGNQKVPEGWLIVAAGNPPEYNKSVREFDTVTLDRIKMIEVEADYNVWREYAYQAGIHPAILSYLELRKEDFYRMETTVDGKMFVTARGWEDLSQFLYACGMIGKKADREVVHQYIRHWKTAKDFANYLELYEKYKKDYGLDRIVEGIYTETAVERVKCAPFDEKLSVVGMLAGKLNELFRNAYAEDAYTERLFEYLKQYKAYRNLEEAIRQEQSDYEKLRKAELLSKLDNQIWRRVTDTLEQYRQMLQKEHLEGEEAFERVREEFQKAAARREELTDRAAEGLEHGFDFMEAAFGGSQEMVSFVTELNTVCYSICFFREYDCDRYYKYNMSLLFDEKQEAILERLDAVENELNRGLK